MRGGLSSRARVLRRDMTVPERRLWKVLRSEGLGVGFRRQHPVPPYILDFACVAVRVAVEVDGGTHEGAADAVRDAVLGRAGWRVVRVTAAEVNGNLDGVVGEISRVLGERVGG